MARRKEISPTEVDAADLEAAWPPDWMTTYSDMATLLMTFFIILSTMLALNIDPTWIAGKKYIDSPDESTQEITVGLDEFTPEQQVLIDNFKEL